MKRNIGFPPQISLESKRHVIIECIAKGMTYHEIVSKFEKEWNLRTPTVQKYVNDAIAYMRSEEAIDSYRSINIQRLDDLYKDSKREGDRKNAIRAIDAQNKMIGAYTENVKVETDGEINFIFNI